MMTKKTLMQYGVTFDVKNVDEEPEALAFLKAEGFQAVPVVFSNNSEPIKGFRPDLLKNLKEAM